MDFKLILLSALFAYAASEACKPLILDMEACYSRADTYSLTYPKVSRKNCSEFSTSGNGIVCPGNSVPWVTFGLKREWVDGEVKTIICNTTYGKYDAYDNGSGSLSEVYMTDFHSFCFVPDAEVGNTY